MHNAIKSPEIHLPMLKTSIVILALALLAGCGTRTDPAKPKSALGRTMSHQGVLFQIRPIDLAPRRRRLPPDASAPQGAIEVQLGLDTGGDQGANPPVAPGLVWTVREGDVEWTQTIDSHPACGCGNALAEDQDLAHCECGGITYRWVIAGDALELRREDGRGPRLIHRHPIAPSMRVAPPTTSR